MKEALTLAIIASLRKQGMNAAHLSNILDVPRRTIYDWIDSKSLPDDKQALRLAEINSLLVDLPTGHLRFYLRFWDRNLSSPGSLKQSLCAENLDKELIQHNLKQLEKSVDRAYRDDIRLKAARENMPQSAAGSLTEYLVACSYR